MVSDKEKTERKEPIVLDGINYVISRVNLDNRDSIFNQMDGLLGYSSPDRWETMIFPANEDGEINNWSEVYYHGGYESIKQSAKSFASNRGFELSDVSGNLD